LQQKATTKVMLLNKKIPKKKKTKNVNFYSSALLKIECLCQGNATSTPSKARIAKKKKGMLNVRTPNTLRTSIN